MAAILTNLAGYSKVLHAMDKHNATQDERIRQLKESVDRYSAFIDKIPRMEQSIEDMWAAIRRLENKHD